MPIRPGHDSGHRECKGARPLRFLNVFFGLWLIAAPILHEGGTVAGGLMGVISGVALVTLARPRGRAAAGAVNTMEAGTGSLLDQRHQCRLGPLRKSNKKHIDRT